MPVRIHHNTTLTMPSCQLQQLIVLSLWNAACRSDKGCEDEGSPHLYVNDMHTIINRF